MQQDYALMVDGVEAFRGSLKEIKQRIASAARRLRSEGMKVMVQSDHVLVFEDLLGPCRAWIEPYPGGKDE